MQAIGLSAVSLALPDRAPAPPAVHPPRRPNILFFFPDQHRFDWTSLNPELPDITPNLKALAARGVTFTNAVCPSPLCAPSRACLASGRAYARCGVRNNAQACPLDPPTVYAHLRAAGYHVLGCGKFDLDKPGFSWGPDGKHRRDGQPSLLEAWGFTDGCDNEGKHDGWLAHKKGLDGPYFTHLASRNLIEAHRDSFQREDHDYPGPAVLPADAYADNWIAANGLRLLDAAPRDAPWFLQVNFNGPHEPMDITKAMYAQWRDVRFPPPHSGGDAAGATARKRRNYGAMIHNIDRWLGVYLEAIRQRGELDNTVIVYSSDHGDMLGDHGHWSKGRPLQPSVGVPLVLAGPGIRQAVSCGAAVETLDLTASFLDWGGAQPLPDMNARSLRPFVEGAGALPRAVACSGLESWRMAFDGQFKLIADPRPGHAGMAAHDPRLVLYDLQTDPHETTDVLAQHPDVVARLTPLLDP